MITAAGSADVRAFRAKLDASILTTIAARTPASAAALVSTTLTTAQATLQARLKDALDRGIPTDRLIDSLATQLATSVAAGLGITAADAIAQIKTVVAQALAPPGNAPTTGSGPPIPIPPASNADLAQRLAASARLIVETAARIGTGPPDLPQIASVEVNGEASRRLAGNPSDAATTARGNPAPGSTESTRTSTTNAPSAPAPAALPIDAAVVLRDVAQSIASLTPAPAAIVTAATSAFVSTIVAATPVAPPPVKTAPVSRSTGSPPDRASASVADVAGGPSRLPVTAGAAPAPAPIEPAPPASPALVAAAVSAPPSDGKRVAAVPSTLLASGGDNLLARVLTRAVQTTTDPKPPADAPVRTVSRPAAPAAAPVATAAGALPQGIAKPVVAAPSDAVSAFVARLADALGTAVPPAADRPLAGDPVIAAAPAAASSEQPAFASVLAPVTADAHPIVPAPPPPAPSAPPPVIVDPAVVVEQLVRGAFGRVNADGGSEIRLQLHPAELGDLTVKLVVSNGDVSASVLATTAQAQDALVTGQAQLGRALADAGLRLTSFTVAQDGGNSAFGQQSSSHERSPSNERRNAFFGYDADDGSDDVAQSAVPTFGPPLAGGLSGGLGYNHLV